MRYSGLFLHFYNFFPQKIFVEVLVVVENDLLHRSLPRHLDHPSKIDPCLSPPPRYRTTKTTMTTTTTTTTKETKEKNYVTDACVSIEGALEKKARLSLFLAF